MNEVFADAFYFIAVLNPSDHFHRVAVETTTTLNRTLVTTTWVLAEVADALSSPEIRRLTHRFLQRIEKDQSTRIIEANSYWYARGLQLYGSRPDKSWSLTDCISFEVMAEHQIHDVLTADHHFTQAGFRALLSPPFHE